LKTISFGGLGDSVLALLKVKQFQSTDHLFVESNSKTLDLIKEYCERTDLDMNFSFEEDPNYEFSFSRTTKWKDRIPMNTSWHGEYHFPSWDFEINNPFFYDTVEQDFEYDFAFLPTAGVNSSRTWNFNPKLLIEVLKRFKKSFVVIGEQEGKSLSYSIDESMKAKTLIAPFGFHVFHRLSHKKQCIFSLERSEHFDHYFHPMWKEYSTILEFGHLQEVVEKIK